MANALIAKAVWNRATTKGLIDRIKARPSLRRICGWDCVSAVPNERMFSRPYATFALRELPANIHQAVVTQHMGSHLCGHISRDSTAIVGREKPLKKKSNPKQAQKRGRPRKGDVRKKKKRRRARATGSILNEKPQGVAYVLRCRNPEERQRR